MSLLKEADYTDQPIHLITKTKPTFVDLARDLEAVEKLGKWIAKSKFFKLDYEEQGYVIATECYLSGMSILEYAKRNKVVAGKPFVQYDAILAQFRERGGSHKVLSMTPDLASIELTLKDGTTSTHSLSWQEAQQEVWPYEGKESEIIAKLERGEKPTLKPKYATPRSRAVMLFARLVSSTIRAVCPEVNYGTYVEEEADDFLRVETTVAPAAATTAAAPRSRSKPDSVSASTPEANPEANPEVDKPEPQVEPEIPKLAAAPGGANQGSIHEPLTQDQRSRIIQLLTEVAQAGDTTIKERVTAKLKASGLEKLTDMSIAEGDVLIAALTTRNANLWLESTLKGPVPS